MGRWAMIFGGFGGSRDDNRGGGGLAALLMLIVAPIAALLIQLGISRQREFSADASGVRMVGHPVRTDQRTRKARRIQQENPDGRFTRNCFLVHRGAAQRRAGVQWTVQHPPAS